jgi:hypothetical protein
VNLVVFFNIGGSFDPLLAELEAITDVLPDSAWGL